MFDTTAIASASYNSNTLIQQLATQDTGDSPSIDGQWVMFQVTGVVGVPNLKLGIRTSPDNVSWATNVYFDGSGGTGSPLINTPGNYSVLFSSRNRYWAPVLEFFANDPGGGGGNSSSSSGQSNQSSSSTGGALAAVTLRVGLVPGQGG